MSRKIATNTALRLIMNFAFSFTLFLVARKKAISLDKLQMITSDCSLLMQSTNQLNN